MDLQGRINKIGKCFVSFNIVAEESAAYAIVVFPKHWTLPDTAKIKEMFKTEIAPMTNGYCFVTEIVNGADCVFDAIDYVITFNTELEARQTLLQQKIKEMQEIFVTEPIEKLKTLKFVFEEPKKPRKPSPKKKSTTETPETQEPVNEEPVVEEKKEETVEENSLLSFVKNAAGE